MGLCGFDVFNDTDSRFFRTGSSNARTVHHLLLEPECGGINDPNERRHLMPSITISISTPDIIQPAIEGPSLFDLRYTIINNEPWFVAKDVCDAINIKNSRDAVLKLDSDEVQVIDSSTVGLTDTHGNQILSGISGSGAQKITLINESGLYTLMLRSRDAVKEGTQAHKFRKWVTSEVLPTIRKTGKYELPPIQPEIITDEQYGQLFQAIQKTVEGTISANIRPKLVNYLKCQFNADPLTNLRFDDLQPALSFLKSTKEQLSDIRSLLRELEEIAVKDVIAGSMPSLRHLKGRYRRELEKKTGKPVSAHELLVHDYIEQNGLALVEA